MFLVILILLAACNEPVSGESVTLAKEEALLVGGNPPYSKNSILNACQTLKEDAQVIRHEGYSAIDKADMIREQAYRVKDEAYEIRDDAYEIRESALEARSTLEGTLVETLELMKNQATVNNLYIQEMRTSLSSLMTRMDRLEQGQEDIQQGMEDIENGLEGVEQGLEGVEQGLEDVEQGQEKIEEILGMTEAHVRGELIPAKRVEQSTTYSTNLNYGPEKAVDGDLNTQSHTGYMLGPWFRYYFSEPRAVGQIKVVNGKLNQYSVRLNGAKVFVMSGDGNKKSCRVNTIAVREGEFLEAQTYYLDCTGNTGIGVEFVLQKTDYLEFREIEVFAP